MKLSLFDYTLPKERIAQHPACPRDAARLLVVQKHSKHLEHKTITDLTSMLKKGDVLVVNNSKVIPARLHAKKPTGGVIEVFLLKQKNRGSWECMLRGKSLRKGLMLSFTKSVSAEITEKIDDKVFAITFSVQGKTLEKFIESHGETPTPPYIKAKAAKQQYQTVYAADNKKGSVAAPTAGLHFTKKLLQKLQKKGVQIEEVTLHVGLGTFSPVEEETIEKHHIHSEYAEVTKATFIKIRKAKKEGRRVVAVGTTSVRVLESIIATKIKKPSSPLRGWVDIYIYPGFRFSVVDAILTNFHLPKSTLLMLVSAFAGRAETLNAYSQAVKKKYRFYSFGDAMFIY